ncbi:autotransporter outer membrane beta-barrel domain-containing protein [Salmonella enterica]|nr:autotransporter outer membrane beta-barrel domain-containing protein [Salmonella enterica]ECH4619824.1 autotransporter outer membrane beta-barrel domain-containing protein [Salmonella enterica]EGG9187474.1 autotransporter outer membrane beta-barrel domain-containing protein [Salmonella enterica]EGO6458206.1 autotransporter outer membrane beta-barrel domain-containing protein [Salmonella enterica]EHB0828123.1 autotransporter outer membrane beta-barrel domain-containing protein [Salmonella ent
MGSNNGDALLSVREGSSISGIKEFRIGEFYADARGHVIIEGENSSVSSGWTVVGDQGLGVVDIINGGRLSTSQHMNIGYVGKTDATSRKGNGTVHIEGEHSTLDVAQGLYLGGFTTSNNNAEGSLTVNNGGTVKAGKFIWLGVGKGSSGIMNIGGGPGEIAGAAGYVETPRIHLGDTIEHNNTVQLNFNHINDDYILSSDITGGGQVNHNGTGSTTLAGKNSYSGITSLNSGTIRGGSNEAFSRNSDFITADKTILDTGGYSQTIGSLTLGGTLQFGMPANGKDNVSLASNTLIVHGNYHGNNGLLVLNTAEDTTHNLSKVNQLYVKGNTTGTTRVLLKELGTMAVSHLDGARVVRVDGKSDGEFIAGTRLVAGAHEYSLKRGTAIGTEEGTIPDSNHWYLTNKTHIPIIPPSEEIVHPDPDDKPTPEDESDDDTIIPEITPSPDEEGGSGPKNNPSGGGSQSGDTVFRPEMGAYLANRLAGNTLFTTRLHDRLGETQYIDPLTGEKAVTSMWLRNVGGHNRFRDSSGQLKTQANRYVLQLGGDIAQWSQGLSERWHIGLMTGYANSQSNSRSNTSRYQADGTVSGYSVGMYATWYGNENDKSGSYLDTWMLYNWFNNCVKGEQLTNESYRSHGITASVETGYALKLGEKKRVSYWLQPQLQLNWMGVKAQDHQEVNGTWIQDKGKGNLQSRLGARLYAKGYNRIDEGKDRLFQPFVEINWLHNSENYAISMNETTGEIKGSKNIAELRTGLEAKVNNNLHLWGNIGQQIGRDGYSDTQGIIGGKILF